MYAPVIRPDIFDLRLHAVGLANRDIPADPTYDPDTSGLDNGPDVTEAEPRCDICGKGDGPGEADWNPETGNHETCEAES